MNKAYLILGLLLLVTLSACSQDTTMTEPTPVEDETDDQPEVPENPDSMNEEATDETQDSATNESEENLEGTNETRTVVVEGGAFYFEPNMIEVEQGETIEFVLENAGGSHDMRIPELGVGTSVIQGGESESFTVTFDEAGEFDFECSVGSHAAQGQTGTIVVS